MKNIHTSRIQKRTFVGLNLPLNKELKVFKRYDMMIYGLNIFKHTKSNVQSDKSDKIQQ